MRKNNTTAFTLIELLVVISIISLLATLAVTSLKNARMKSRDAKRLADIKQIDTAMQLYFDKYGHYPDSNSTPAISDAWLHLGDGGDIDQAIAEFMPNVPADPINDGTHYLYYDKVHSCENVTGSPGVLVIYNLETDKYNNCATVCGNTWTGDYCIIYEDQYID